MYYSEGQLICAIVFGMTFMLVLLMTMDLYKAFRRRLMYIRQLQIVAAEKADLERRNEKQLKDLKQLAEVMNQLSDEYDTLLEQYNALIDEYNALTVEDSVFGSEH